MRLGLKYLFSCLVLFAWCFAAPVKAKEVKACLNSHCTKIDSDTFEKSKTKNTQKKKTAEKTKSKSTKKPKEEIKKVTEEEVKEESEEEIKKPEIPQPKTSKKTPISQKLWQGITSSDLEILKKTTLAIEHKNYDEALRLANEMKSHHADDKKSSLAESLIDVIFWNKFSDKIDPKKVSFSDISRFAIDNPFYPNIENLHKNVERVAIANEIPYNASEQYFKSNPAETKDSKIYLLNSKISALTRGKLSEEEKEKERKIIQELLVKIWVKENFTASEEQSFLEKYRNQLNEIDHINRIKRLLWDNKSEDAERIMGFVEEDYQKLFRAVNELEKNPPKHLDKLYHSVPWKLRLDELLTHRRILWYRAKDKIDDVIDLMLDLPKDSQFPEKWWSLRRLYGREMIKQKKYKQAYKLISEHNLPKNSSDFWEAEWTSGWIALRFLDKPKDGYSHFANLYRNVSQPVTLSRAAYWLGMAAEASGNRDQAIEWYKTGTKYPIFFYGQLAIHKHRVIDPLGAKNDIILPKDPEITAADFSEISKSRAARAAFLLSVTGDKSSSTKIFEWIVNNAKTDGQISVIMQLVNEIGDRQLDARISRIAAKRNVFFIKDKFQIVKEISDDEYAPLVHAIVKQESGFAPTAVSQVGAIGFMQLMPGTAKLVAKELGVSYNKTKLATDIHYNVRLGSFYIKKLINRFNGSEMLAIAAYNAGPNAVQRWINEFYDPRQEQDIDKVVDWIELITYSETRNYVQRIMENLIVYKYLMSRSNYDSVQ
ncbi:MAG: lytic transglycosylase domain-containing protein [Proteobacteria bacterium]|nr:lytic transglycosylase domain-containing protein [Pseudomonadota bacterium]